MPQRALQVLTDRYEPGTDTGDPWPILVATVLSARTRDEATAPAAARVLQEHPTPASLAEADPDDLVPLLKGVGFLRQKARTLVKLGAAVRDDHGGEVPRDRRALEALPGVGPKTAACVLCYAFGEPVVAVDVHVHRIANRLGWVSTDTPEATEAALTPLVPEGWRAQVNELLVRFGREVCLPRGPQCGACPLNDGCPSAEAAVGEPLPASEGPTMLARIGRDGGAS